MSVHFTSREVDFWTPKSELSPQDNDAALSLISSELVQECLFKLEIQLLATDRPLVTCMIAILDEALPRNLVFELQGPHKLLQQIRDRAVPGLAIYQTDPVDSEHYNLRVPMTALTGFGQTPPPPAAPEEIFESTVLSDIETSP